MPTTAVLDEEFLPKVTSALEAYLAAQHCTLWGQAWNINEPQQRQECAEFVANALVEAFHYWKSDQS